MKVRVIVSSHIKAVARFRGEPEQRGDRREIAPNRPEGESGEGVEGKKLIDWSRLPNLTLSQGSTKVRIKEVSLRNLEGEPLMVHGSRIGLSFDEDLIRDGILQFIGIGDRIMFVEAEDLIKVVQTAQISVSGRSNRFAFPSI